MNSFFFVMTKVDRALRKIFVLGGKGWKFADGQIDYPSVETELAEIHKRKELSFFVVEQNNTGLHVVQTMKRVHKVPTYGITTSNRIKDRKTISRGQTMDKKEHVGWINQERQAGRIVFPLKKTPGILVLENQIDSFVRDVTKAGTTTYSAESGDDDAVMAFMVNSFFIRRHIFGDYGVIKRTVLSKKFESRNIKVELGSGIPPDSILLDREIRFPTSPQKFGGYRIR